MSNDQIPPTYWRALHNFCHRVEADTAVNRPVDADRPPLRQMSAENRAFLQAAMAELVESGDPIRHMKQYIATLTESRFERPNEEEEKDILINIEALSDLCVDIDLAKDFHTVGGFRILGPMVTSESAKIRASACNLTAELAQNHPFIQRVMIDNRAMDVLLRMAVDDPDVKVQTKALYAVSCLIRENDAALKQFVKLRGVDCVLRALYATTNDTFVTKCCFLLTWLAQSNGGYQVKNTQLFSTCLSLLVEGEKQSMGMPAVEQVLHLLTVILKVDRASCKTQYKSMDGDQKNSLLTLLDRLKGSEECYEEVIQYSKCICDSLKSFN